MHSIEPQDPAVTYASVLDALPIVAFLARVDGSIAYVSRGWVDTIGTEPSNVLGNAFGSVIHPDQRERAVAIWLAAVTGETAYRDEMLLRFGNGAYRWIVSQANPMRDPQTRRIIGWFGTVTDIDEHKRIEETLRAQIEFNARLIDSSDDGIHTLDLVARIVSLSRNGQRTLRIADIDTVLGMSWFDLWRGTDQAAARAATAAALAGGTGRFTGAYAVAGDECWFDVAVTAILDAFGRPEKLLAVLHDVTVARRTNEALKQSEARSRAFGEALPGITWSASPQGELDYVNEQWSPTRGRDRGSALGYAWLDGVHPDDRAATENRWRASIESGAAYEAQFRVAMADGTYRWQLVRALPMRDETGTITRWIGVNIDIDEQRRADNARDMFVALVENSSDFIAIGDRDGNVVYVNEAGRTLLEIATAQEATTTPLLDYFCSADREYVRDQMLPAIERDGRQVGDFRFRNFRTGAAVPVAYNFFRLLDRSGAVIGIATVSRDRRAREQIDAGLQLLARTGAATLDSLDYLATLRNVAQAFVPDFAAYCIIDVLTRDNAWQRTIVHREPALEQVIRDLSEPSSDHASALALLHGKSSLVVIGEGWLNAVGGQQDRIAAVAALGIHSFVSVPVVMPNGEIVGGLTCARDSTSVAGTYTDDSLAFVQEAGRRAGAAIANVRLYERERRIAVELQAASLPAVLPRRTGLRLDAEYRPGSNEATIGGDWYDAFELEDGRMAITVGDVLGHGLHAAVTMTKLRQAMQSAAMVDPDPNVMLTVADKTLRLLDGDGYATALAAIYDDQAHTLTYASAGHPGPLVRTNDGLVEAHTRVGLMLGLRGTDDDAVSVIATPNQGTIVFFTDGIVEATRDLEAGMRRLHEAVGRDDVVFAAQPARAIVDYVLGTIEASDDLAVLVAQIGLPPLRRPVQD